MRVRTKRGTLSSSQYKNVLPLRIPCHFTFILARMEQQAIAAAATSSSSSTSTSIHPSAMLNAIGKCAPFPLPPPDLIIPCLRGDREEEDEESLKTTSKRQLRQLGQVLRSISFSFHLELKENQMKNNFSSSCSTWREPFMPEGWTRQCTKGKQVTRSKKRKKILKSNFDIYLSTVTIVSWVRRRRRKKRRRRKMRTRKRMRMRGGMGHCKGKIK